MGLLSGLGSLLGGKKEGRGYRRAGQQYEKLLPIADYGFIAADPFSEYRQGAANILAQTVFGGPYQTDEMLRKDPGYQFRQEEGQRAVERAASARGFNRSGNVLAALQQRSQDLAAQEYGNIINRLSGLAGATPQAPVQATQLWSDLKNYWLHRRCGCSSR